MDKETVQHLIEEALHLNSETAQVECKDARGGFPKDPVMKSLSAFGNTHGGILVFGVAENTDRSLTVVGVQDFATLQEHMSTVSATEMSEVLRLSYHHLTLQGMPVLAVAVPECENRTKPYHIKKYGMPRGAYVRDGNTDRQMTEEEMRSYVRNAHLDDYDSTCAEGLTQRDLSAEKLDRFLSKSAVKLERGVAIGDEREHVLANIGIITECAGETRPTIAGYLLFARSRPQNTLAFERYVVRCVRYKGASVASDILDKADIDGTLDEQIDKMQAFVLRNIANRAEIVGTKRVERYEYPEKAIREIVANAVIHRDYRITETYTQVNIFADRIEVFNPGNLPPGVTVENIREAQATRNRVIAARLKDMEYLEEFGRGIDIVFSEMQAWGLHRPLFKNVANSFKAILPGEALNTLNERQFEIWKYILTHHSCTSKQVRELLPDTPVSTVNYDLRKLVEQGVVKKLGSSMHTYYESHI